MALVQNKPSHFNGREKICIQTKFELSRWTLALKKPIFSFRSLNKLGPLASESVEYEAKTIIFLKKMPTHQISAL